MRYLKKFLILSAMLGIILCLSGCEESVKKENTSDNNSNTAKSSTTNNSSSSNNSNTNTNNNTANNKKDSQKTEVDSIDFMASAKKQIANPEKGETIAIMHIKNYGDIKIKFFKDVAPKAVENFITHAKNGYYNGLTFHRVIDNFMIQGGDPTGTGRGGQSIWGTPFEDEFSYDLVPYRGALCMANSGSNTNGSQFFIEQAKYDAETAAMLKQYGYPDNLLEAYKNYGGSMHLFTKHTVFGQVFEGMDIVDKIATVETDDNDKPVNSVIVESIEIVEY